MTLVPIVFASLLIVAVLFIVVLSISFLSYKIRGQKKSPYKQYQTVVSNERRRNPVYNVTSRVSNKIPQQPFERENNTYTDKNKVRPLAPENSPSYPYEQKLRRSYRIEDRRDERISREENRTESYTEQNEYKATPRRPRLTVLNTLNDGAEQILAYGSGEHSKSIRLNFNPIRYYDEDV